MDWSSIIVGGLACVGTLIGSLAGIRQSNKVFDVRLTALEKKMDKHNNLIERMTRVEDAAARTDERLRELETLHRRGE